MTKKEQNYCIYSSQNAYPVNTNLCDMRNPLAEESLVQLTCS